MHTKESLLNQLQKMGIQPTDTVLVHSSFKQIGEVEGGPDTVLDALETYLADGLLVLPTHTWAYINADNPRFSVTDSKTNVGILTERFRHRPGVFRSAHPTHSVAAKGKDAETFVHGQEQFDTPCARESVWGKLLDRKAKILLVGVDLRRNTFTHGIEEWADVPGRLTETTQPLESVLADGTIVSVPSRRHTAGSWSENYWKLDEVLQDTGAMTLETFGDATVRICDTVRLTSVITNALAKDIHLLSTRDALTVEQQKIFEMME